MLCIVIAFFVFSTPALSDSPQFLQLDTHSPLMNAECPTDWGSNTITANTAYTYTGCIYTSTNSTKELDIRSMSSLTVTNCRFTSIPHRIVISDGSLSNYYLTAVSFSNTVFDRVGLVSADGGSIYLSGSVSAAPIKFSVTNCTFRKNTGRYGGAILLENVAYAIVDSFFYYNYAAYSGGAMRIEMPYPRDYPEFYYNYPTFNITHCDFANNEAGFDGGAVFTAFPTIDSTSFAHNRMCNNTVRLAVARNGYTDAFIRFIVTIKLAPVFAGSCSDSTGDPRVAWDDDQTLIPNCSVADSQQGCNPEADATLCTDRIPNTNRLNFPCGSGCVQSIDSNGALVKACERDDGKRAQTSKGQLESNSLGLWWRIVVWTIVFLFGIEVV